MDFTVFSLYGPQALMDYQTGLLDTWGPESASLFKWTLTTPEWNFDDPLTFQLALSSGQNFNFSDTLVYDQIPEPELMTFPSASAVLYVLC